MQSLKWTLIRGSIGTFGGLFLSVVKPIFVSAIIASPSISNARPWLEHTQHLSALSRQIEVAEHEIQTMIEEKRHLHSQAQIAEIMRSIASRQREIEKVSKSYEEERQHVRFEHPEKNDQLDHVYIRHEIKSIEDLENDLGIDARLDRVKARVLAKFPIPDRVNSAEVQRFRTRLPASKNEIPDEDAPEKIILAK